MDYEQKWGRYRLRLTKNDIKKHSDPSQQISLSLLSNFKVLRKIDCFGDG